MEEGGLGRLPPVPPYHGISLEALQKNIKNMGDYPMYRVPDGTFHLSVSHRRLNRKLFDMVEYVKHHVMIGLKLSDYTQRESRKRPREDD
jgi:hypothetical protein